MTDDSVIKATVRAKYGEAALRVLQGQGSACCGGAAASGGGGARTPHPHGAPRTTPDASVDVIISNCVINLAADKRRVLAEAFRVLRPGGRFAVSDVVVRGEIPSALRRSMELWVGCVAGALEEEEFKALLAANGFADIGIEPTRIYELDRKSVV